MKEFVQEHLKINAPKDIILKHQMKSKYSSKSLFKKCLPGTTKETMSITIDVKPYYVS